MAGFLVWISQSGVVQGVIIGATLALFTAILVMKIVARSITATTNGWRSVRVCGQPDNGILVRAASALVLPVVNVFEEAAYWTTTEDGSGRKLRGDSEYILHFAAGQLPPNSGFWSLTMTDVVGYMVKNPIDRYSVGDRSFLAQNDDGSTDIYLQRVAPPGHENNWLPAPAGPFKLMLRSYLPGAEILDGTYSVPPVLKVH